LLCGEEHNIKNCTLSVQLYHDYIERKKSRTEKL
jgi:hypothetical protein